MSIGTGFLFDSLVDTQKDLMRAVKESFPKETEKFLKEQAKKLRKKVKKVGRQEVGTSKGTKKNWTAKKSYHQKFKIGKIYVYAENDKCIRVYNSAPHAHLVEQGHVNIPRGTKRATTRLGRIEQLKNRKGTGMTLGRYVFTLAEIEYKSQFLSDTNEFLYQFVDDTVNGKI